MTVEEKLTPLLQALLAGAQEVLGEELVGLYLLGSLAIGGFKEGRSDVDFAAACERPLTEETIARLAAMHARITAGGLPFAEHMEGSYIHLSALRRYDPADTHYPALRCDGSFAVDHHGPEWIIQRHVLREHGRVLYGPDPRTLIDPIPPEALRGAAAGTLREWWAPMLDDPKLLRSVEYQAYAALTMCRGLYTIHTGGVASKPAAAAWALQTLDARWAGLIERALAYPDGPQPDRLAETLEFIRFTVQQAAAPGKFPARGDGTSV